MDYKKWIPAAGIVCLSLGAWLLELHHFFNLEVLKAHQATLKNFVQTYFYSSLILYMGLYTVVVFLSMPVASFMTITGGVLFGQWIGTTAVVGAATAGACGFFLSARLATAKNTALPVFHKSTKSWDPQEDQASKTRLHNPIFGEDFKETTPKNQEGSLETLESIKSDESSPPSSFQKMRHGFQENAFFYLLTLRLIPLFPFVVVNLAAAFFQISLKPFFWGTFLGIIPGTFVYVSMGVALDGVLQKPDLSPEIVLDPKILTALIGLGVLALLPIGYRHFKARFT